MSWQMDKTKLISVAVMVLVALLALGLGVYHSCEGAGDGPVQIQP